MADKSNWAEQSADVTRSHVSDTVLTGSGPLCDITAASNLRATPDNNRCAGHLHTAIRDLWLICYANDDTSCCCWAVIISKI